MSDAWGVLILLVLGLLVGGPLVALVALMRVRRLERRIKSLERRGWESAATPAVAPPPAVGPGRVPIAPPAAAAIPAPAPPAPPAAGVTGPPPAPPATAPPSPRPIFADAPLPSAVPPDESLETMIAGRWLNRVGLFAVAVGVSFFLKYAIDNDWIGPHGQVALGLLLGVALVAVSFRFVARGHAYFGDGLTGLGGAVLYLSLWAAGSYYHLVGTGTAFVAMVVVTTALLAIAVGRNSQRVATLAMSGGFATPWLLSTGQDAQVVLFSYVAILNAALLPLARTRDWRWLELPAFVLTQVYFWGWHDRFYTAERLWSTAAFGTLFFAEFAALQAARARRTSALRVEEFATALLNGGTYLLMLRVLFWPDRKWTLTIAVLALAAAYLFMAQAARRDAAKVQEARLLFAGLALTMVTLAIPIRLEGRWITMAWAIEAGVLMLSGLRAGAPHLATASLVLFSIVGVRLVADPIQADVFLVNARVGVALVVLASAAAALWAAARWRARLTDAQATFAAVLSVAANVLAVVTLTLEVGLYFGADLEAPRSRELRLAEGLTVSMLWTAYASALMFFGLARRIAGLRWQALGLFGLAAGKVLIYDLANLQGFYRIVSSIALGAVLLVVSFLYQRRLMHEKGKI